jgi:hypothetical protein
MEHGAWGRGEYVHRELVWVVARRSGLVADWGLGAAFASLDAPAALAVTLCSV